MDSAALCPPWHESRGGGSGWSGSSFASLLFALATFARTWMGAESKLTVSSGMSPWYFLMKSSNHFSVKPLSANSANARQNDGRDGTLVLTAPAGHVLRISGGIEARDHDRSRLRVYDGANPDKVGSIVLDMSGAGPPVQVAVPAVTSSGRSMAVYFRSSGDVPCAGLDLTVTVVGTDVIGYETWAAASGVSGAWNETDALGIHNVFRYAFDKPTGAFENPPLLSIHFENGAPVVVATHTAAPRLVD